MLYSVKLSYDKLMTYIFRYHLSVLQSGKVKPNSVHVIRTVICIDVIVKNVSVWSRLMAAAIGALVVNHHETTAVCDMCDV